MSYFIKPKEVLPIGLHKVKITKISKGINENSKTFDEVRFENMDGYFEERYYLYFYEVLYLLFETCGMEILDFQYIEDRKSLLLGKELLLRIQGPYGNRFMTLNREIKIYPQNFFLYPQAYQEYLNSHFEHLENYFEENSGVEGNTNGPVGFECPPLDRTYWDYRNPDFWEEQDIYNFLTTGCTSQEEWNEMMVVEAQLKEMEDRELYNEMIERSEELEGYEENEDTINHAFEGDPEWYWNID